MPSGVKNSRSVPPPVSAGLAPPGKLRDVLPGARHRVTGPVEVAPAVGASGVRGFVWSASAGAATEQRDESSTGRPRDEPAHESSSWCTGAPGTRDPGAQTSYPLAHPLTQPYGLPVSPLVLGYAAAALVLVVAFAVPRGARRATAGDVGEVASWAGSLSAPQVATRAVAVGLLVLAIVAGRAGEDDELENLAPALVVGVVWPLRGGGERRAGPGVALGRPLGRPGPGARRAATRTARHRITSTRRPASRWPGSGT